MNALKYSKIFFKKKKALMVYLGTAYFAKIEIFVVKSIINKGKRLVKIVQ